MPFFKKRTFILSQIHSYRMMPFFSPLDISYINLNSKAVPLQLCVSCVYIRVFLNDAVISKYFLTLSMEMTTVWALNSFYVQFLSNIEDIKQEMSSSYSLILLHFLNLQMSHSIGESAILGMCVLCLLLMFFELMPYYQNNFSPSSMKLTIVWTLNPF